MYLSLSSIVVKYPLFKSNHYHGVQITNTIVAEVGTKSLPFNAAFLDDIEMKLFDLKREVNTDYLSVKLRTEQEILIGLLLIL